MKLETFRFSEGTWSVPSFPPFDSLHTLVLVFGAPEFLDQPQPFEQLAGAYPQAHMVGCSSAGEIFGTEVFDGTLAVAVAKFESGNVEEAFWPISASGESFAAGEGVAKRLQKDDLAAVLVLSEGVRVNGSELVRGLNSVLPDSVIVTGGLAGDADRFQRTWVIQDGRPVTGGISAIGLYGDRVRVGHGSKGGWDNFGPERTVTRAEGNVVFELDGQPALELYKRYLGERAQDLPSAGLLFPLALRPEGEEDKSIVRTILAVDEERQSMTFAGDVPQGVRAQLMKANFDRLVQGASDAATMALGNAAGEDTLCVAISCVGRRLVLGERTEEETEATLDVLPVGTKQIGFYSYGEISPYTSGHCDLHNQTMTLTTISEA